MILKSKIYFIIIFNIFLSKSFACHENLQHFPFECSVQDRFLKIRNDFIERWDINIDDIYFYKASRFIDDKSLEKAIKNKILVQNIYDPKPTTWQYWEKGVEKCQDLSNNIISSRSCHLTVEQLKQLHNTTITNELIGPLTYFSSWFLDLKKTPLLGPGILRSTHLNFRPFFSFNCGDRIPANKIKKFIDDSPKDSEGISILDFSYSPCPDSLHVQGSVYYSESVEVPKRIEQFVENFNLKIGDLLKCNQLSSDQIPYTDKNLNLSPYELAADFQRWYVAIHPFREGNGRLSRFIQDMISQIFDLPYVPASKLQNDLLVENKQYKDMTKKFVLETLDQLELCLNQYEEHEGNQNHISFSCRTISLE
jgi:hypothetical protein